MRRRVKVNGAERPPHNKGMPRRGAPLRGAPCRRRLGDVTVRERRRACLRSAGAALRHAGDAQNVMRQRRRPMGKREEMVPRTQSAFCSILELGLGTIGRWPRRGRPDPRGNRQTRVIWYVAQVCAGVSMLDPAIRTRNWRNSVGRVRGRRNSRLPRLLAVMVRRRPLVQNAPF